MLFKNLFNPLLSSSLYMYDIVCRLSYLEGFMKWSERSLQMLV